MRERTRRSQRNLNEFYVRERERERVFWLGARWKRIANDGLLAPFDCRGRGRREKGRALARFSERERKKESRELEKKTKWRDVMCVRAPLAVDE